MTGVWVETSGRQVQVSFQLTLPNRHPGLASTRVAASRVRGQFVRAVPAPIASPVEGFGWAQVSGSTCEHGWGLNTHPDRLVGSTPCARPNRRPSRAAVQGRHCAGGGRTDQRLMFEWKLLVARCKFLSSQLSQTATPAWRQREFGWAQVSGSACGHGWRLELPPRRRALENSFGEGVDLGDGCSTQR
jgi:hypothetical protein